MSRIESRVHDFLRRAHLAMRCGMRARYLRQMAKDEGVLEYLKIYSNRE